MTPAVKALLIANVAVFLLNWILGGGLGRWFGASFELVLEFWGLGLLRLVTYQFVHSIDPWHIFFNMLLLYMFGTFVERRIGSRAMYRLYLTSGVVGGVLQILLQIVVASLFAESPAEKEAIVNVVTVGASGACYGVLTYAAFLAPRMVVILIVFPIELRWLVGFLIFLGIYATSFALRGLVKGDEVAHGAHLGGALWGFVAFRWLRTTWAVGGGGDNALARRWRNWRAQRARRSAAERLATLDHLIDKVHREGMSSLSAAERRFLERTSRDMKRR
jgi:membrane associated rhomboid family serine protease